MLKVTIEDAQVISCSKTTLTTQATTQVQTEDVF